MKKLLMYLKKHIVFSIILLVFIILGLSFSLYKLLKHDVKLDLKGDNSVTLSVGNDYQDSGLIITDNGKEVKKEDIKIEEKSNVETDKLGEYKVTYKVTYRGKSYDIERIIKVVDDVNPEITTNVEEIVRDYCTKKDTTNLEYTANDNYDGDITDKVTKEEIEDNYKLSVSDSSNNETVKNILIKYSEKPQDSIVLNGNATTYITVGASYNEPGAYIKDGCGAKLNDEVVISGNVDTNTAGDYIVTYTSKNNNSLLKTRKVIVYVPKTTTNNGGGKTLYLTFDDGPGIYTQQVLDTLAKFNVKATFFVTNQFPKYVYLIGSEHNAGHAVGVHTYTHAWNVYDSVENYLDDFNKMNSVVEKYTGSRTRIFRFPGGSSNTVSKKHSAGVVTKIANRMTNDGYVYFDWDVSSGDASNASSTQIYNNVINGAKRCSECVILMHDIKKNTVNVLDQMLSTLTSSGYNFGTLNTSSPTAHQRIAN